MPHKCTSPTGDLWFLTACQAHDICYATCNSDKSQCDLDFKADMVSICEKLSGVARRSCYYSAQVYYIAVRFAGDSQLALNQSFSLLQDAACDECCCTENGGVPKPWPF